MNFHILTKGPVEGEDCIIVRNTSSLAGKKYYIVYNKEFFIDGIKMNKLPELKYDNGSYYKLFFNNALPYSKYVSMVSYLQKYYRAFTNVHPGQQTSNRIHIGDLKIMLRYILEEVEVDGFCLRFQESQIKEFEKINIENEKKKKIRETRKEIEAEVAKKIRENEEKELKEKAEKEKEQKEKEQKEKEQKEKEQKEKDLIEQSLKHFNENEKKKHVHMCETHKCENISFDKCQKCGTQACANCIFFGDCCLADKKRRCIQISIWSKTSIDDSTKSYLNKTEKLYPDLKDLVESLRSKSTIIKFIHAPLSARNIQNETYPTEEKLEDEIKIKHNKAFAKLTKFLSDKYGEAYVMYLESIGFFTTMMLDKYDVCKDRRFIPQNSKGQFNLMKHDPRVIEGSAIEVIRKNIRELKQTKICSIWLDYMCTFEGNVYVKPQDDIKCLFDNELFTEEASVWFTVCRRGSSDAMTNIENWFQAFSKNYSGFKLELEFEPYGKAMLLVKLDILMNRWRSDTPLLL